MGIFFGRSLSDGSKGISSSGQYQRLSPCAVPASVFVFLAYLSLTFYIIQDINEIVNTILDIFEKNRQKKSAWKG
jgi:hypothetical protein